MNPLKNVVSKPPLRETLLHLLSLREQHALAGTCGTPQHQQLERTIARLFAAARKRGEVCACHKECTDEAWGPSGGWRA